LEGEDPHHPFATTIFCSFTIDLMYSSSLNPLAFKLIRNGIRYRYLRATGNSAKPQALSIEITQRCISQCIMCNIWKSREVDLPVKDWISLLCSPFFSDLREIDLTGGEPFLREDLMELINGLSQLKDGNLRRIKSLAITTNGFLTHRILKFTEEMIEILAPKEIDLVMVLGMDGMESTHDKIRNYPEAWTKVHQTIQGLRHLRTITQHVVIGLKTTVLPQNVDQLEKISSYAEENGIFTIISPCIITENRYRNIDRKKDLVFSEDEIERMILFYKSGHFRWDFHRSRLVHFLETGVMKKPCSAGFNYLFIRSNGEVYPCPLIKVGFGNIKEAGIKDLFLSKVASSFRRKVGRYAECKICTEPGLERYALPFEGFTYLSLMMKMGKRDFLKLHHHMGLDKYFS
jgi:MoaA/NifB/PqqE/SkfB family radical SAM enzyme